MTPNQIRRAALWLRRQAEAHAVREANARRERLAARARIATQPRDPRGRWTGLRRASQSDDRSAAHVIA